jgi:hypothetical protein
MWFKISRPTLSDVTTAVVTLTEMRVLKENIINHTLTLSFLLRVIGGIGRKSFKFTAS